MNIYDIDKLYAAERYLTEVTHCDYCGTPRHKDDVCEIRSKQHIILISCNHCFQKYNF